MAPALSAQSGRYRPAANFGAGGSADQAEGARILARSGAVMIVLESIPPDLAAAITAEVAVPTIGIGAGPDTDGQVLVIYDLLGMNGGFNPSFLKKYADMDRLVTHALEEYRDEVRTGRFPPRRNKS